MGHGLAKGCWGLLATGVAFPVLQQVRLITMVVLMQEMERSIRCRREQRGCRMHLQHLSLLLADPCTTTTAIIKLLIIWPMALANVQKRSASRITTAKANETSCRLVDVDVQAQMPKCCCRRTKTGGSRVGNVLGQTQLLGLLNFGLR